MTVVTFDFDDTLTQTQWDKESERFRYIGPNRSMMSTLLQHVEAEDEVHIIVTRLDPEFIDDPFSQPAPARWLHHQLGEKVKCLAGVHYTSQDLKWRLVHKLGSMKHYDDDQCELDALPPGCVGIRVPTLHNL
jgi:hypothetical protein